LGLFDDLVYIDIPVPFKRGDILTITSYPAPMDDDPVFVLDSHIRDNKELHMRLLNGDGDGTDMIGWGFFVSDIGVLYGDHTGNYDCFEYCNEVLNDKERLLHYVSLYLKDEIKLPELLTMQCKIMLEHQLNNGLRIDTHGCYIPENLLAGNRLNQDTRP
jgi:hypothetical protein